MSAWGWLLLGSLMEIVWAVLLRYTESFSRPLLSLLCLAAMAGSVFGLMQAQKTLSTGLSYAIWVGIGAAGTFLVSAWLGHETLNLTRVFCVMLIIGGVIGLKIA